jgi:hypothetical protein
VDVFGMASFTLIIACGNDMSTRLPGVTTEERVSIDYAKFHGLRVRNTPSSLDHSIAASTWRTRGWTYQESVLSSRKLFVTPAQLIRLCSEGTVYEDPSMICPRVCQRAEPTTPELL